VSCYEVVQSFATVPDCCDFVSQIADRSQRDLLVDSAVGLCVSLLCPGDDQCGARLWGVNLLIFYQEDIKLRPLFTG
jgi:hypothetical protein